MLHLSLMPVGRLLYRASDEARYVVVQRERTSELWVVEDGWSSDSAAAGPFHPDDVLRAFRLANTSVPDGCELCPWQPGIILFSRTKLPGHPNDWSRLEPAWLSPSFTRYTDSDVNGVINEKCCAPPQDAPRVDWGTHASADATELGGIVRARHLGLVLNHVGTLRRTWNVHPAGSPVFARDKELSEAFVVVDLPPP